jgi:hypothetical protein
MSYVIGKLWYYGWAARLLADEDNVLGGGGANPDWEDALSVSTYVTAVFSVFAVITGMASSHFDVSLLKKLDEAVEEAEANAEQVQAGGLSQQLSTSGGARSGRAQEKRVVV